MKFGFRICAVYCALLALSLFLVFRLYTVTSGEKASQVLSGQYLRKIEVAQRRGFIYDRSGSLLNARQKGYICLVSPSDCTSKKSASALISSASGRPQSEVYDRMLTGVPFLLRTSEKAVGEGIFCYPLFDGGTTLAEHTVGYVNSDGDGVVGAEKRFDALLSGSLSGTVTFRYCADAVGRPMKSRGSCLSDDGYTEGSGIYLTLDKNLQTLCETIAEEYSLDGAICITDTHSGEILASVSSPGFDSESVAQYLSSSKGELVNRCTSSYTPGSVFKTVVAAAALEKDLSLYGREYNCEGCYELENGDKIPCHSTRGHGSITMNEAYALSCNPYFISLAEYLGHEAVTEASEKMGMTADFDVDGVLYVDASLGNPPTDPSLTDGYTANLAIGQGRTLVTPINVCTAFACAVTGKLAAPRVLSKIRDGEGAEHSFYSDNPTTVLKQSTTELLCEMMRTCVEEGLGKSARTSRFGTMGKTATAQSGQRLDGKEILNLWFCGVYPGDEPEFTVCVLSRSTENNGRAKEIFRRICNSDVLNDI